LEETRAGKAAPQGRWGCWQLVGVRFLLVVHLFDFGKKVSGSILIPREACKLLLVSRRLLAALLFVAVE
jgi:hypothetical protein